MADIKRVFILGARGMLGHILTERLSQNALLQVQAAARKKDGLEKVLSPHALSTVTTGIDVNGFEKVQKSIEAFKPDWIINGVGIIKQLPESSDSLLSFDVNALFPHRLSEIAQTVGARVLQVSTDCVFSGRKGNYVESDPSDVNDIYGVSKHLGELHYPHALTLRTSIIGFEVDSRHGLLEWFISQKGGTVKGFKKAIYSGLTTGELSRVIESTLLSETAPHGLWHVASKPLSKLELLQLINERFGLKIRIEADEAIECDRSLDGSAFTKATGYRAPSWDKMIEELASHYTKRV